MTYGELAPALDEHGLALHNLASLPHIAVGGAVATATHGSGDAHGNLATAVAGLELVTSSGDVITAARGEPDFDGLVVGLGALGAVTRITLDVEPAYAVRQRVFEELPWEPLLERFDEVFASGYSVSVFTHWGATAGQLWVKSRGPDRRRTSGFGARPATVERHPILGIDPVNCTAQLGKPGPWFDRLPHFRMGFIPSSGDELQSEYLLPRGHAVAAIDALRSLADRIAPGAAGLRDPHGRRRPAVDQSAVRARGASASTSRGRTTPGGRDARDRGRSRPRSRRSTRARTGASCSCRRPRYERAVRLRRAGGAARPARRVPQRVARGHVL